MNVLMNVCKKICGFRFFSSQKLIWPQYHLQPSLQVLFSLQTVLFSLLPVLSKPNIQPNNNMQALLKRSSRSNSKEAKKEDANHMMPLKTARSPIQILVEQERQRGIEYKECYEQINNLKAKLRKSYQSSSVVSLSNSKRKTHHKNSHTRNH